MSLYAAYIKEREGKEIIETDKGFLTFSIMKDGIYIEDVFTSPDHRHSGESLQLVSQVSEIAKERGLTKLFCSVIPTANNSTLSLKVVLAHGFKLNSSTNNFIWLEKRI